MQENDQNFQVNQTPVTYRMRCPLCRKLYSVEPKLIEGVADPRFICVACQTEFLASQPQFGSGLALETRTVDIEAPKVPARTRSAIENVPLVQTPSPRSVAVETRPCPKCGTENAKSSLDCGACGIVFARYRPGEAERVVGDIELTGRVELINLWEAVTARYNDASLHEEFVRACYEAGCLPFASQKYARILVGAPEEEIARKMRKRIVGLASAKFERSGLDKTTWKVPLPSFNNFIILLGVILLFVGLGFPKSHDIAGVGIAMLALAVGLKYFTRRPA